MSILRAGRFYNVDDETGEVTEVEDVVPDYWVCRRLDDFEEHQIPLHAAMAKCEKCDEAILFNPERTFATPVVKVCMQCAGFRPMPIPEPS